jgi:hypothetical protein
MGRDSRTGDSRPAFGSSVSVDVPLAVYAVVAGVLAVSAGAIVNDAQRWGILTKAISLLTTVTITVVAGITADSVLGWLIHPDLESDSSDRP